MNNLSNGLQSNPKLFADDTSLFPTVQDINIMGYSIFCPYRGMDDQIFNGRFIFVWNYSIMELIWNYYYRCVYMHGSRVQFLNSISTAVFFAAFCHVLLHLACTAGIIKQKNINKIDTIKLV